MHVTCECGATGERQMATGRLGDMLNRAIAWRCEACDERAHLEQIDEELRQRYATRERRSSVPEGLRRDLTDLQRTPHNAEALRLAREWTDGRLPGLVLTGPVGVGKTWIAGAAVWERQLAHPVHWASVPLMMINARREFGDEQRAAAMEAISGIGALALDDLDKVKPSPWACEQLFAAIDSRIAAGRRLLVTMNLTLDGLEDRFSAEGGKAIGEAIASRLSTCNVVWLDGPDQRLAGKPNWLTTGPRTGRAVS